MTRLKKSQLIASITLLCASVLLLAASLYPFPVQKQALYFPGKTFEMDEDVCLVLSSPKFMWAGSKSRVMLQISPVEKCKRLGIGPQTRLSSANLHSDQPETGHSFNLMVETRLDLPGIQTTPADSIRAPLTDSFSRAFIWELSSFLPGEHRGIVWFNLDKIGQSGVQLDKIPLSAQRFLIHVLGTGSITVFTLRWVAGVIFFISFIMGVPLAVKKAIQDENVKKEISL